MARWIIVILLFLAASISVAAQPAGASGAIVAIEEPAGRAGGGAAVNQGGTAKAGTGQSAKASATTKTVGTKKTTKVVVNHPTPPPPPPSKYSGDIIGDKFSFLNFEVVDQVQPVWTNANKAAGAKGLVQVEILVERDGRVLTAHARTGNPLLWPEAERAALATRLNSPTFNNRSVRAMGFLVYRFGPPDDDD